MKELIEELATDLTTVINKYRAPEKRLPYSTIIGTLTLIIADLIEEARG